NREKATFVDMPKLGLYLASSRPPLVHYPSLGSNGPFHSCPALREWRASSVLCFRIRSTACWNIRRFSPARLPLAFACILTVVNLATGNPNRQTSSAVITTRPAWTFLSSINAWADLKESRGAHTHWVPSTHTPSRVESPLQPFWWASPR